jgi:hypothetical protein
LKKSRAKHRSYINNNVANTLVEHNGELRAGNMADLELMPWNAIRNDHEHTFAGAKQGWLDRMNRNATKSWGRAPPRVARLQRPVPLPPADAPIAAVGSSDEVPMEGNMSDQASADVAATNINDTKDLVSDSQGSDVPTPELSSLVSPDQDRDDAGGTVATNVTDTNDSVVDFQGMDQPVADVTATVIDDTKYGGDQAVTDVAAAIIDDTKFDGADSQGSDAATPQLSSPVSPDQEPASQMSTTTTASEGDVSDTGDIVATNVTETNDSIVDFQGMDQPVADVAATIMDDPAKTTDSETHITDAGDIVATNVADTNDSNVDFQGLKQPDDDDTKYGGDDIQASDVSTPQLSSHTSSDHDLAKTTSSETGATDAGDRVATNVTGTNDSSVDNQGSVDQALSPSSDMSSTDATDDHEVDLQEATTMTTGDIGKGEEESAKNSLLADEKSDKGGKDPV